VYPNHIVSHTDILIILSHTPIYTAFLSWIIITLQTFPTEKKNKHLFIFWKKNVFSRAPFTPRIDWFLPRCVSIAWGTLSVCPCVCVCVCACVCVGACLYVCVCVIGVCVSFNAFVCGCELLCPPPYFFVTAACRLITVSVHEQLLA